MREFTRLFMIALLAVSPTAQAYIVDTGTPTGPTHYVLSVNQYFAGRVILTDSYSISSIEGYFDNQYSSVSGMVTVSLHSNSGNLPGSVLESGSFSVPASAGFNWRGVAGLNWTVGPGTYWVSFTPDSGVFGLMRSGAPSPLSAYAYHNLSDWFEGNLGLGMRVDGTAVAPVPLPAAAWLLLSGLAGLGFVGRRHKMA